jgi:plastocyanin
VADRRKVVAGVAVLVAVAAGGYLVWGPGDDDGADGAADRLDLPAGTIVAVDFEYPVAEVTVRSGDPLTFENRGPSHHTLTADDGRFDSGVIEAGGTFTVTLDGPRQIEVHCEIHPAMQAVVNVTAP